MSGQETPLSSQNSKPRSRKTHRRYYNDKRFAPVQCWRIEFRGRTFFQKVWKKLKLVYFKFSCSNLMERGSERWDDVNFSEILSASAALSHHHHHLLLPRHCHRCFRNSAASLFCTVICTEAPHTQAGCVNYSQFCKD